MPREIDLREVQWLTITPENYEEQFAIIEAQEGELVFLAMTIPDYEVMAYNMQELKRYITELKDVVVYYRKVTTNETNEFDRQLKERNQALMDYFEKLVAAPELMYKLMEVLERNSNRMTYGQTLEEVEEKDEL